MIIIYKLKKIYKKNTLIFLTFFYDTRTHTYIYIYIYLHAIETFI